MNRVRGLPAPDTLPALRPEYALGLSDLNPFLFAAAGRDEAGQDLTILSVLARLGLDPWVEAARLANLPKEAAVRGVAAFLCQGSAKTPDANGVAKRLVDLLPRRAASPVPTLPVPPPQAASFDTMKPRPPIWLICIVAAVAWYLLLSYMKADTALEPPQSISTNT